MSTITEDSIYPVVRAGVAVFLYNFAGEFLVMKRNGSHGAGTWGLPGGHIELGELAIRAAAREIKEELCEVGCSEGLHVARESLETVGWSEAVFPEEKKHYITILFKAPLPLVSNPTYAGHIPIITSREPDKCSDLRWVSHWDLPKPLFTPLENYVLRCGVPDFRNR